MAKTKKIKKASMGQSVSSFILKNSKGEDVDPTKTGKTTVLYFYPKDNTPGCTLESQQFNELIKKFILEGAVVFGISRDSVASHDKFICKFDFKFELLSDPEEIACGIFDVIKEKNMYGRKVMGIVRSTFILDKKGTLISEFRGVKADGHAAEVLKAIKEL